jgi:hypothetical protein
MDELKKTLKKVNIQISAVWFLNIFTAVLIFFSADRAAYSDKSNVGNVWAYLFWYLPLLFLLFKNVSSSQQLINDEQKDLKNELRKLGNVLGLSIVYIGLMLFNSFFIIFATETARIIDWLSYFEKLNFIISIYLLYNSQKLAGGKM